MLRLSANSNVDDISVAITNADLKKHTVASKCLTFYVKVVSDFNELTQ